MRRKSALILLALFASVESVQACGPRCGARHRHPRLTAPRVAYTYPSTPTYAAPQAYSQAQAYPVTATAVAPAPAVITPSYEYPTQPVAGEAYYYTYDNSGKLIIQQWGDWLFRGGKEAGMPRPPLPIVGYLQRR